MHQFKVSTKDAIDIETQVINNPPAPEAQMTKCNQKYYTKTKAKMKQK